ncbi:ADP-ribosylglycohydrolase family protein [Streptomyces mirabilis]|uniref:ADP-ribosylglycohydrolase family protein n=1 Tax=Streptomyces mirabilis TaxID=68239 RepID=UPI00341DC2D2
MPWTTTPPRARRSLEGSALGDAFGERWLPLFRDRPQAYEEIRARRAPEEPDWHWTDDTAMALGIFRVLDEHGEIRQPELAQAFALGYDADPGLRLRHAPTAPAPPPGAGPLGGTGTRTLRRRGQPRQRMGVPLLERSRELRGASAPTTPSPSPSGAPPAIPTT